MASRFAGGAMRAGLPDRVMAASAEAARRRAVCPAPVLLMMLAAVLLQRLAVPGTDGIVGVGLLVGLGGFAWGVLSGRLAIEPLRVLLYCLALCGLLASLIGQSGRVSFASLALLSTIYLPFVAVAAVSAGERRAILDAFGTLMSAVAVLGLAQFAVQFLLGPEAMFPLDRALPEAWFIDRFNLRIPIWDGAPWLKSTGLVFLEPSHFAQTLALAILVELLTAARTRRLALYGLAYLVTVSGTGLVLLGLLAVPVCLAARRLWPIALGGLVLVAAWTLRELPPLDLFFGRLDEFAQPLSSGAMRFVAPYRLVSDTLADPSRMLLGAGPGTLEDVIRGLDYAVQDTLWLKLLVEYGLLGLLAFAPLYLVVLLAGAPDRILAWAFLVQVLLLGGYLNAYYVQFLALALVGWPRLAEDGVASPDAGSDR